MTRAPSFAKASATARPIPDAAPVTSATGPLVRVTAVVVAVTVTTRVADELGGVLVERSLAPRRAEVVRLAFVQARVLRRRRVDLHAADRIRRHRMRPPASWTDVPP